MPGPSHESASEPSAGAVDRRTLLARSLVLGAAALGSRTGAGGAAGAARGRSSRHVAVVGAGAFGGWTALWLRRRGAQVTLVDAWGPGNARASSSGETRVIRAIYGPDRTYVDWVARSRTLWRESERLWDLPLLRRTGVLWMFQGDDGYARSSLPLLAAAGLEVEELAPAEAARRYPQISFDGVRVVYLEPGAGYLRAHHACRAVALALGEEGGRVRIVAARPGGIEGGELAGLELSDGSRLTADAYVFACGPWLGQVWPELAPLVRPTRQEVFYFGPPPGDAYQEDRLPVWIDFGERIFYGIPGDEHRGFKVADDTRGEPIDPTTAERTLTAEGLARTRGELAQRFPGLSDAPFLEGKVCQYENSPDGHFLLDRHPGLDNVWLAGGGSGHGFKMGPAVGEHVADLVLGRAEPLPQFALARLPPELGPSRSQFKSAAEA